MHDSINNLILIKKEIQEINPICQLIVVTKTFSIDKIEPITSRFPGANTKSFKVVITTSGDENEETFKNPRLWVENTMINKYKRPFNVNDRNRANNGRRNEARDYDYENRQNFGYGRNRQNGAQDGGPNLNEEGNEVNNNNAGADGPRNDQH